MEQIKSELNKESLIKLVKDYYSLVYKRYKEKKTCEYRLPSSVNFDALKELAIIDKIPEAIFSFATYKEGKEILKGVFSEDIVDLFGNLSIMDIASMPETSLKLLRSKANKTNNVISYFDKWKEKRHIIIFGSHNPYYNDKSAFDRIINQILPIATKDIWEEIISYFTDSNMFHLPEHVNTIKEMYRAYNSPKKEKKEPLEKKEKAKNIWLTIKKSYVLAKEEIDGLIAKQNIQKIEKLINESTEESDPRVLYTCIAYLLCDAEEKQYKQKAIEKLFTQSQEVLLTVYCSLSDEQKTTLVTRFISGRPESNMIWKKNVVQAFMKSTLKDEDIGMIISNLGELSGVDNQNAWNESALKFLGNEDDFWKSLGEIKTIAIVNTLWTVLPPEKFYKFAFYIIQFQLNDSSLDFCKFILSKWESDDVPSEIIDEYCGKFRECAKAREIDLFSLSLTQSREKIRQLNGEKDMLQKNDTGKATAEKFMTALTQYEEIEWLLAMLLDDDSKGVDFAKNKLRSSVESFRRELEYCGVSSIVDYEKFLSREPEQYVSNKYVVSGAVEEGAEIKVMSMGMKHIEYSIEKLPRAKKIIVRKK